MLVLVKIISPNRRNDVEPQVWCFLPGRSNCLHHVRPDKTTRVTTVTESVYLLRCSCRVKRRLDGSAGFQAAVASRISTIPIGRHLSTLSHNQLSSSIAQTSPLHFPTLRYERCLTTNPSSLSFQNLMSMNTS